MSCKTNMMKKIKANEKVIQEKVDAPEMEAKAVNENVKPDKK